MVMKITTAASAYFAGGETSLSGPVTAADIDASTPLVRFYLQYLVKPSQWLLRRSAFTWVVNTTTAVACVTVGVSTYVEDPSPDAAILRDIVFVPLWYVDLLVVMIFLLEVIVRFVAKKFRPLRFFFDPSDPSGAVAEGKWNSFDLFVVIVTLFPIAVTPSPQLALEQIRAEALGEGTDSGSVNGLAPVLRLLRLARLLKIFKSVAQLQVILRGLGRGIQSVGYVVLMLILVLYIFAVIAMIFFSPHDPFAYPSLIETLVNLFRAATLEDWTDLMYVTLYSCDPRSGYPAAPPRGRWMCRGPSEGVARQTPTAWFQVMAMAYWVAFIIVASFVMLSLFVGAITLGMAESVEEVLEEKREVETERARRKGLQTRERLERSGKLREVRKLWIEIARTSMQKTPDDQLSTYMASLLSSDGDEEEGAFRCSGAIGDAYIRLGGSMQTFLATKTFNVTMLFTILFASIVVGMEAGRDERGRLV